MPLVKTTQQDADTSNSDLGSPPKQEWRRDIEENSKTVEVDENSFEIHLGEVQQIAPLSKNPRGLFQLDLASNGAPVSNYMVVRECSGYDVSLCAIRR